MTLTRTDERIEFLSDILTTAIENFGYGWFWVSAYKGEGADTTATIHSEDLPDGAPVLVTLNLIAAGIGVISRAVSRVDDRHPGDGPVLHNAATGQRLYLSGNERKLILEASRDNDPGEIDVTLAMSILECAVFGAVTFG